MAIAQQTRRYTAAEYLELERKAEGKNEYFDGQIFAMAGASPRHSIITMNVGAALTVGLRGKPCRPYGSNLRVHVPATGLYTYPDALVICGPLDLLEGTDDTATNPTLIVEVLSPSTEGYTRGAKFHHYQSIPSFREYLLISQDRPAIDHFVRLPDNSWRSVLIEGTGKSFPLETLKIELSTAEIYDGVEFDEQSAP